MDIVVNNDFLQVLLLTTWVKIKASATKLNRPLPFYKNVILKTNTSFNGANLVDGPIRQRNHQLTHFFVLRYK